MSELMQLSGSVIKEFNEKRKGLQQDSDMEQLVYSSVMYAVGTRCGFDLSVQEQDFSQIGLSTLFQTNFFRLFFRYCTGV